VIQVPANPLNPLFANHGSSRQEFGTQIFGRSLLAQGLLVTEAGRLPSSVQHLRSHVNRFQQMCHEINRSPLEVCLLWARDHPHLDGIVVGAASISQLRSLAAVLTQAGLSMEERSLVDSMALPNQADLDPRNWK
jgi:aryl-alcohol dehydrogenase-like predicted oxidoreductase